jgi:hypothetical protein
MQRRHEVNVNNSGPLLFRYFCSGLDRLFDTCIVEREIQATEGFDGLVQRPPYVIVACYIASDGECMSAEIHDHLGRLLIVVL